MQPFPQIKLMGVTGVLVRFADRLSEPANRAALAYRAAVEAEGWSGVLETTTALASAFLRIDPISADPRDIATRAEALARGRDWTGMPLPTGRTLWRIPCAWGGRLGPDLADAAALAGLSEADAIAQLSRARTRVLTLGFAPGQPYLGELPPAWDLPRREALQNVPGRSLLLAVRQLIIFTAPAPTGWRHVGQTGFAPFAPDAPEAVPLRPGDEIEFPVASEEEIEAHLALGDGLGGAVAEPLS